MSEQATRAAKWLMEEGLTSDCSDDTEKRLVELIDEATGVAGLLAAGKAVVDAYGCECLEEGEPGHCPMCQLQAEIAKAEPSESP